MFVYGLGKTAVFWHNYFRSRETVKFDDFRSGKPVKFDDARSGGLRTSTMFIQKKPFVNLDDAPWGELQTSILFIQTLWTSMMFV